MRRIGIITGEGFKCEVIEDDDKRVFFTADMDICADGANGQDGGKAAYRVDDRGSELLANGGMKRVRGKVVCAHSWARDVVILGEDNEPKVFPGGVIASKTWYKYPGKRGDDPEAYVDAQTVPYIVVPPLIIQGVHGIVRGCHSRATYNGKTCLAAVLEKGPTTKTGEGSIALARALGIPSSPRTGGIDTPKVFYEIFPGIAAEGFELQPA